MLSSLPRFCVLPKTRLSRFNKKNLMLYTCQSKARSFNWDANSWRTRKQIDRANQQRLCLPAKSRRTHLRRWNRVPIGFRNIECN